MWDACFAPDHAKNLMASIFATAVGVFLIIRMLDQWQIQRARRRSERGS